MSFYSGNNHSIFKKVLASLFLVLTVALVSSTALLAPRPARAIPVEDILGFPVSVAKYVGDKLWEALKWAWERGAAIVFRNAARTLTQKFAYDVAVMVASGGHGQTPQFTWKNLGQSITDAADDAAGTFIEGLGKGFTNFDVCNPGGVNPPSAKLIIGTVLFEESQQYGMTSKNRPKNKCSLSSIKDNWAKAINDTVARKNMLKNFGVAFDPKQHDLGITLTLKENLVKERETKGELQKIADTYAEGYKPITEAITGFIKTPAPRIRSTQDWTTKQALEEPLVFTGDILADALGVFTNTLAARLMKRLQQGDVPSPSALASGKFSPGGLGVLGPGAGAEYAIQVNSAISTPQLQRGDVLDIISELANCPDDPALAPPNNCTIDSNFQQVLTSAQSGQALTVQEAINKNSLIHGNWIFKDIRPARSRVPDAWYLSDLKKLRRARVIPVGWELAAQLVLANNTSKTLQDIIGHADQNYKDGFNGTGPDGKCGTDDDTARLNTSDPNSPSICGLIDPNWVLRAPSAQCPYLAPGQQLEPEGGKRAQACIDFQNCVAEKADGSCEAWGYCTKEKNIWRFSGDSCETTEGSGDAPYATCQSFQSENGAQVSYLKNSLVNFDDGVCADAAGCRWYSSTFTPDNGYCQGSTDVNKNGLACQDNTPCGDGKCSSSPVRRYSDADNSRLFLKGLDHYTCDVKSEGCRQFLRLSNFNSDALALSLPVGKPDNPVERVVGQVSTVASSSYQKYANVEAVHLREAPDYLKCYDLKADGTLDTTNDSPECKNYLTYCKSSEVGCELYTPSDGSPGVPAKISPNDTCPAECVGFNTYEQVGTYFDSHPDYVSDPAQVSPGVCSNDYSVTCNVDANCGAGNTCLQPQIDFIPKTAQKCSASNVGCEEFTNIEAGEKREYYSGLRQCIKKGDGICQNNSAKTCSEDSECGGGTCIKPADQTYYTWVGSDLTGYQLKPWQLLADDPSSLSSTPKLTTKQGTWLDSGDCRPDGVTFPTPDPDCKQFYDSTGQPHYVFASKTITASDSCIRYRATNVVKDACDNTGGDWQIVSGVGACYYRAIAQEGKKCSSSAVGCREFKGPTADNVKLVFPVSTFGDRENNVNADTSFTSGWNGGTNSTESTSAFGHSFNVGATNEITKDVTGKIKSGKQYLLSFWAKTRLDGVTGAIGSVLDDNDGNAANNISFGTTTANAVTNEWQVYLLGPVEISATGFNLQNTLTLKIVGTTGFYIDNIIFKEVADTFYVRKNTWNTPITCQSPADLRCSSYTNRSGQTFNLTKFSNICRAEAVGCEALVDTRNSSSPQALNITGDNQAALANLNLDKPDQVVYRVYDPKKSCLATAQACTKLGAPKLKSTGEIESWSDKFVKLDPDSFFRPDGTSNPLSPLCSRAQDRCAEFKDDQNVTHFFRDPGDQVCEYKLVDNTRGPDWYKKGTNEPCNLLFNGSFEQYLSKKDSFGRDIAEVTAWRTKNLDPVTHMPEKLTIQPSFAGKYWQTSVMRVETSATQYSGTEQDVSITPNDQRRLFLTTADFYIPKDVDFTADPEYWYSLETTSTHNVCKWGAPNQGQTCGLKGQPDNFCGSKDNCQQCGPRIIPEITDPASCTGVTSQWWNGACWNTLTCHYYYNVADPANRSIDKNSPRDQWIHRYALIRLDPMNDNVAITPMSNTGGHCSVDPDTTYHVGNQYCDNWGSKCPAGQTCIFKRDRPVLIDNVKLVELPSGLSDDQAKNLASVGYANLCPAEKSSCSAFFDPYITKRTYYYLDNDKLDRTSCQGKVSEKEGCLMFNNLWPADVGTSATELWNAEGTYGNSASQNNLPVTPQKYCSNDTKQKCSIDGDCGAGNTCIADTNIILKVRRDRTCAEWMACQSEAVRFVGTQPRSICYSLGRCDRWGGSGVDKCSHWQAREADPKPLTIQTYQTRGSYVYPPNIDWGDLEYSGYSIPNIYPIDTLTQKNYSTDPNKPDIRLTHLGKLKCNGDPNETAFCGSLGSACTLLSGKSSTCLAVDYGIAGTVNGDIAKSTIPKSCRAYPEKDSPFPDSIVKQWGTSCDAEGGDCIQSISGAIQPIDISKTKEPDFKDSNNCQKGLDCECSYKKASYTQGESLYYGFNDDPDLAIVTDVSVNSANNKIQTKSRLKKQEYQIGLKGFCLEKDPSRLINAGLSQDNACLSWMPFDVVGGEVSIYDFAPEAGFQPIQQDLHYCLQGQPYNASRTFCIESDGTNCTKIVRVSHPRPALSSVTNAELRTGENYPFASSLGTSNICRSKGQQSQILWAKNTANYTITGNGDNNLKNYYAKGQVYVWTWAKYDDTCNYNDGDCPGDECGDRSKIDAGPNTVWYCSEPDNCGFNDWVHRECNILECGREEDRVAYTAYRTDSWDNQPDQPTEACVVEANVYNTGSEEGGVWTDRITKSQLVNPLVSAAIKQSRDNSPFGAAVTPVGSEANWNLGMALLKPMCRQSQDYYVWSNEFCPAGKTPEASGANYRAGLGMPASYGGNIGSCSGDFNICWSDIDCAPSICRKTSYYLFWSKMCPVTGENCTNNAGTCNPNKCTVSSGTQPGQCDKTSTTNCSFCNAGANKNMRCTSNPECPGGTCTNYACGVCKGNNTLKCKDDNSCYVCSQDGSRQCDGSNQASCKDNTCAGGWVTNYTCSNSKVCYNATNNGTPCQTVASCTGNDPDKKCDYKNCDNGTGDAVVGSLCTNSCNASGSTYNNSVVSDLQKLFAQSHGVYGWDESQGKYTLPSPHVWDVRSVGVAPEVRQVVFDPVSKNTKQGERGFTLKSADGSSNSGDVKIPSSTSITAMFYAYNPNGEQMPLTDVYVDWGDSTLSGAKGKYKNHKDMCAPATVCAPATTNAGKSCKADTDCGGTAGSCIANSSYTFGDWPQACMQDTSNNPGYFNYTHVYTCSNGQEPACSGPNPSNCFDASYFGPSDGACIYAPRVFVMDNWQWCTGNSVSNYGKFLPPQGCDKTITSSDWLVFGGDPTNPGRVVVRPN